MLRWTLFTIGLLAISVAPGQYPYTRTLELRAGQQRPKISCIAQDQHGLIWAGTDIGILRTDGEQVDLVLRTADVPVQAMTHLKNEVFAALASGVILRCNTVGCNTVIALPELAGNIIRGMVVDPEGRLWIATSGYGLYRIVDGLIDKITIKDGMPDDHVNGVALFENGNVAAATDQGLVICKGTQVQQILGETEGAPDNLVLAVSIHKDGSVWAGTDRQGVFVWYPDRSNGEIELLEEQWKDGPVHHLAVRNELVWVGTRSIGMVLFDRAPKGGRYQRSDTPMDLQDPILDVVIANDGSALWCTGSEVIFRADPAVLFVPDHEGVDMRRITALCTDATGDIWFATKDGLFTHPAAFGKHSFIERISLPVKEGSTVVSLVAGRNGEVWAATFGNGIYKVNAEGSIEHYSERDGLINDNVLSIREYNGTIWCATIGGLCSFKVNERKWTNYTLPGPGFVYDVLPLNDDSVLVATDGSGLILLDKKGNVHALDGEGPRTYYMLARSTSAVWAVGPTTGLVNALKQPISRIAQDRIPFDGELYALGTSQGHVIVFGSTGIAAYDPVNDAWSNSTSRLGLHDVASEFNVLSTSEDGTVWFGCDKGLVRIRPNETHFKPTLEAFFTRVSVGSEYVKFDTVVTIPHDRNMLMVKFTALDVADPAAVRFAYRLVGHTKAMFHTRDREVQFNDLPAGSYKLEVRAYSAEALNERDLERIPPTVLHIQVERAWWQLLWVQMVAAILLFGAAFLLLRMRDERIREKERNEQEKVRFQLNAVRSQVNPHFLFNSFNALVVLIETDTEKAVEHVGLLSTFFRNILQVRDKDLITVKEEIVLLQTYFALEKRRFGSAIDLSVDSEVMELQHLIVPLTLQLLVENALKHNRIDKDRTLTVSIRSGSNELIVTNPVLTRRSPAQSTGFGLESITKRYAAFTTRPVQVEENTMEFIVRIPLIDPDP